MLSQDLLTEKNCLSCGKVIFSNQELPVCAKCETKKTWGEMTLEEKVEDLNTRLKTLNLRDWRLEQF